MSTSSESKRILLAPAPRVVADIFDENDQARLRALGELTIHDHGPMTEELVDKVTSDTEIIIGQIDLPEFRLKKAVRLKAIFNVEGNFLPNVDYEYCFRSGIRVLNISPVFAEPVAEAALGMAIDLARGITRSDRGFRDGNETYGLTANQDPFSLFRQDVGIVGMGDLGTAICASAIAVRMPYSCIRSVAAGSYLRSLGCGAAPLAEIFKRCRLIFVVAGVTSANQGFLGAEQFASMQPGSALVLASRAAVVDFDAMLDFADKGHIRVATDVFPEEPLPTNHRARRTKNTVLFAHQAGALKTAIKRIGKVVVADAELIARGLPPVLCKSAQPETVGSFRSNPVTQS